MALLAFLLLCVTFRVTAQSRCVHRPDAKEIKANLTKELTQDIILGRMTYNIIDKYRANTQDAANSHKFAFHHQVFRTRIYGMSKCEDHQQKRNGRGLSEQSSCPWFVYMDIDMQREPMTMAKGKCSCKSCLSNTGVEEEHSSCMPINSYIPVIRWGCPIGKHSRKGKRYFQYFKDLEAVPVGCTCLRRDHSGL